MDQTSPNARRVPAHLRTSLFVAVYVALYSAVLFHYALTAPIALDENTRLRSLQKPLNAFDAPEDYVTAIDHPAVFRWVGRAAVRIAKASVDDVRKIDPSKSYEWNIRQGRAAPRRPVMVLRATGTSALCLAMVCLFFATRRVFGGCAWGYLVAAPLALSPSLGRGIGGYVGADAYLAFFLALALALWLKHHLAPRGTTFPNVVSMGVVIGLALSTKLNGGLLLVAYLVYLVLESKGIDRVWRPVAFVSTAFTVFVAVNPVLQKGGVAGLFDTLRAMLAWRGRVYRLHEHLFGTMPGWKMFTFMFPYWYLLPLAALLVWGNRRERWFAPVILWSLFLVVGTAVTINQPFTRYLMPIDFGITVSVMLSAIAISRRLYGREMTMREVFRIR